MNFQELLFQRKSIRKYLDKPIESEKIEALKRAILLSPTGKRKNHWDFIFVENKATLTSLADSKLHGSKLIGNAALAVAVIGDNDVSDTWIEDCSIASIILQLQAEDLGLGSCWVQIHKRPHSEEVMSEEYVRILLDIPETKNVLSIVAIGYPEEKRPATKETDLLWNKIHDEKF
ncbi:MAG: nitroreductase family protein [Prolixibacteraceae bacterium]|jgi:nitroreductase|nr:nitroreductase family protein [Prolixibacteraceae bacterium]